MNNDYIISIPDQFLHFRISRIRFHSLWPYSVCNCNRLWKLLEHFSNQLDLSSSASLMWQIRKSDHDNSAAWPVPVCLSRGYFALQFCNPSGLTFIFWKCWGIFIWCSPIIYTVVRYLILNTFCPLFRLVMPTYVTSLLLTSRLPINRSGDQCFESKWHASFMRHSHFSLRDSQYVKRLIIFLFLTWNHFIVFC